MKKILINSKIFFKIFKNLRKIALFSVCICLFCDRKNKNYTNVLFLYIYPGTLFRNKKEILHDKAESAFFAPMRHKVPSLAKKWLEKQFYFNLIKNGLAHSKDYYLLCA